MTVATVSGLIAAVLSLVLWMGLRARSRHLDQGIEFLREHRALATELLDHEMPERLFRNLVVFSATVGSGSVARRLFAQVFEGRIAEPMRRELIHANRKEWEGFHSQTRVLYVRTFFAGLRADSYFAGTVRGTLFRRAVFYLNADPGEVAHAVDAMETRILLLGAEREAEKIAKDDSEECRKMLAAA